MSTLKNYKQDEIFDNGNYTFNHIRNAIAHLHIELEESNYNNKIENIILKDAKDIDEYKKQNYNFKINISVDKLKEFAIYIADEYVKDFF